MNRWFLVGFAVLVLLTVGVWGYYFYRIKTPTSSPITKNTLTSTPNPNTDMVWDNVPNTVASDCKAVAATSSATFADDGKLFGMLLGNQKPSTNDVLLIVTVPKNGNLCRIALLGNSSGTGSIAYQTESGATKKLKVVNTPVTNTSLSTPIPSPSK